VRQGGRRGAVLRGREPSLRDPLRSVALLASLLSGACGFPDVQYAAQDGAPGDASPDVPADSASVDAADVGAPDGADADAGTTPDAARDADAEAGPVGPALGTASKFAVLAGTTVTNTGPSAIVGDLGVAPGTAITGITAAMVVGAIHAGDAVAIKAQQDLVGAYNALRRDVCTTDLTGSDLGGRTLTPGVYCYPTTDAKLTGTLVLDAQGNPGAVFVFQLTLALATTASSRVSVINGGAVCNVFWQVGSSATIGGASTFAGNVLASTTITLGAGVLLDGRALAQNGAVTMDTSDVSVTGCP